jgi:hypothetical protein
MAKGDDIEERLIKFAVRIVKLCDQLPKLKQAGILLDNYSALAPLRRLITRKRVGLKAATILFTSSKSA